MWCEGKTLLHNLCNIPILTRNVLSILHLKMWCSILNDKRKREEPPGAHPTFTNHLSFSSGSDLREVALVERKLETCLQQSKLAFSSRYLLNQLSLVLNCSSWHCLLIEKAIREKGWWKYLLTKYLSAERKKSSMWLMATATTEWKRKDARMWKERKRRKIIKELKTPNRSSIIWIVWP